MFTLLLISNTQTVTIKVDTNKLIGYPCESTPIEMWEIYLHSENHLFMAFVKI